MAKAGADVWGSENQGGFASDNSTIIGYSHMHDSGTGGVSIPKRIRQRHSCKKKTVVQLTQTLESITRKLSHLSTSWMP
jgi:hypothetical protein